MEQETQIKKVTKDKDPKKVAAGKMGSIMKKKKKEEQKQPDHVFIIPTIRDYVIQGLGIIGGVYVLYKVTTSFNTKTEVINYQPPQGKESNINFEMN